MRHLRDPVPYLVVVVVVAAAAAAAAVQGARKLKPKLGASSKPARVLYRFWPEMIIELASGRSESGLFD